MNYRCVLCSADLWIPDGLAPLFRACDSCAMLYYRIQREILEPREEVICEKLNRQYFSGKTINLKTSTEYPLTNQPIELQ
jgi:hypothetical protein